MRYFIFPNNIQSSNLLLSAYLHTHLTTVIDFLVHAGRFKLSDTFWGAQFSFLHLFVIPRFDVIAQSHSSSFSFFTSPFLSFCYWAILCQWALAEGSKFANFWNFNSLLKQKVGIFSKIYQLFFNYMNQHCLFILSCATFDTYWQVAN